MIGDLGTVLAYLGFIILAYGTLKYGNDVLRGTVGDSVFIGAAGCTGLTGATLAACQKAQPKPKPKPVGITAAKPKPKPGITAARPRGITAANPNKTPYKRSVTTGGGVGGPTRKALTCRQNGGTWRCYTTGCICRMPIRPTEPTVVLFNQCIKNAKLYTDRSSKLARDRLAMQYGYTGLNPGDQLSKNNAQTPSAGYQERLLYEKFNNLFEDLKKQCVKKYLGVDPTRVQEESPPISRADPRSASRQGAKYAV